MIDKIDKSNFRQVILDFPKQFEKALKFAKDKKLEGKFNRLVVCGIGGSALPGDLVKAYLDYKKIDFPVTVCRNYTLPVGVDNKTLIFTSSYSGSTEETLSCFEEIKSKNLKTIGFARGGSKLDKACQDYNMPFVEYPDDGLDFQPRCALGYSFTSMIKVLSSCGVIDNIDEEIKELAESLKPGKLEEKGKEIAQDLEGLVPIIYSSEKYRKSVAQICKIKINENSKTEAFYNAFPEMNHNEMVGYTRLQGKYHVIIFRDLQDHERILKRFDITSKILEEKGVKVTIIDMNKENDLEKIFNALVLFDWVSYYVAIEAGQDPTPVDIVEDVKKMIAE